MRMTEKRRAGSPWRWLYRLARPFAGRLALAAAALVLSGAVVILPTVHEGLTLVMLVALPPVVIAAVIAGVRLERLSKERQEAAAEASVVAEESLAGIRTVQAFAREDFERARYSTK